MSDPVPDALAETCRATPIVDTHEHMRPRAMLAEGPVGLRHLIQWSYVAWALGQEGLPLEKKDVGALDRVRNRAFYRHWLAAMQRLYGFDGDLTAANWDAIDAQVAANYETSDWHRRCLRDSANAAVSILDPYWDHVGESYDTGLFVPTLRINPLAFGYHPESRDHNGASAHEIAAQIGMELRTFEDYEAFCCALVRRQKARGIVCLKSALAYDRDLRFAKGSRHAAQRAWGKELRHVTPDEARGFAHYIIDLLAEVAAEEGLPFQWHTGLALLDGSRPANLIPLVRRHPGTTFVLLHGGYPWTGEWAAMAFSYPNVVLDMTWLANISPTAAVRALSEALDVANGDVICAGGGDAWTPEEAVGALDATRAAIARALTNGVADGRFGEAEACALARRILYDNAMNIYPMPARFAG